MLFWLIIGVALGYIFKPQLEILVGRILHAFQDRQDGEDSGH